MRLIGFLAVFFSSLVFSQDWPKQRPVQIVVGFGPGATTDTVARLAAQKLQEALGQGFVVENRPGAGGNIATQQLKRAAADGYTILVTSVAYAVNPSLYANAGYDALADFAPVRWGRARPTSSP
jgi:tripartite-type tricarboxylate transporter receptor subunit TctC